MKRRKENLDSYQKKLLNIKRHKKKTVKHTWYALIFSLIFVLGFQLFDTFTISEANESEGAEELNITLVGDIMTGRHVENVGDHYGYDFLFRHVQPYFDTADFLTGNFENPVLLNGKDYQKADKNIHLKTDVNAAQEMERQGFDVLSLANNHAMDFNEEGLIDTLSIFNRLGVGTVGAGENLSEAEQINYNRVNGYTIATLGFSDVYPEGFRAFSDEAGILAAKPNYYMPLVQEANENADVVIVHMHWGIEYDSKPSPRQQEIGRALIDAGADIVAGHHPHVLQPIEFYNDGVIFHSLGNFVFDQGWSRPRESALVQYKILNDELAKVEVNPMYIKGAQPRPVNKDITGFYRWYKIVSQITQGNVFSDEWHETWNVEGNKITHVIRR